MPKCSCYDGSLYTDYLQLELTSKTMSIKNDFQKHVLQTITHSDINLILKYFIFRLM